jgi:hypothetical protein
MIVERRLSTHLAKIEHQKSTYYPTVKGVVGSPAKNARKQGNTRVNYFGLGLVQRQTPKTAERARTIVTRCEESCNIPDVVAVDCATNTGNCHHEKPIANVRQIQVEPILWVYKTPLVHRHCPTQPGLKLRSKPFELQPAQFAFLNQLDQYRLRRCAGVVHMKRIIRMLRTSSSSSSSSSSSIIMGLGGELTGQQRNLLEQ